MVVKSRLNVNDADSHCTDPREMFREGINSQVACSVIKTRKMQVLQALSSVPKIQHLGSCMKLQ